MSFFLFGLVSLFQTPRLKMGEGMFSSMLNALLEIKNPLEHAQGCRKELSTNQNFEHIIPWGNFKACILLQ